MIFGRFKGRRIFLRPGRTDMRKQINGLMILTQEALRQNPLSGDLFVFCGRRRNVVKILYYDRTGFCLWMKRVEEERFPWPKTAAEAQEITREQLIWLLNGIDFTKAHRARKYSQVV
jgi:transposase